MSARTQLSDHLLPHLGVRAWLIDIDFVENQRGDPSLRVVTGEAMRLNKRSLGRDGRSQGSRWILRICRGEESEENHEAAEHVSHCYLAELKPIPLVRQHAG